MNALRALMQQHDRVEGLLVDLTQAGARGEEAQREALLEFARELRRHLDAEESLFYSVVSGRLILVGADRFVEEHARLRELIAQLEAEHGKPGFSEKLEDVHDLLVQHVSDEEIELFPEVKRRFSLDELEAIGERIEQGAPAPVEEPARAEEHETQQDQLP